MVDSMRDKAHPLAFYHFPCNSFIAMHVDSCGGLERGGYLKWIKKTVSPDWQQHMWAFTTLPLACPV